MLETGRPLAGKPGRLSGGGQGRRGLRLWSLARGANLQVALNRSGGARGASFLTLRPGFSPAQGRCPTPLKGLATTVSGPVFAEGGRRRWAMKPAVPAATGRSASADLAGSGLVVSAFHGPARD